MKYFLLFTLSLVFTINVSAQLHLSYSENRNDLKDWNRFFRITRGIGEDIFNRATEINMGYALKLPTEQIKIIPSIGYSFTEKETFLNEATFTEITYGTLAFHQVNCNFNFKIYPLDFFNIEQLTANQRNYDVLTQGLYFLATPSLSIFRPNYSLQRIGVNDINRDFLFFEFRYGVGLGFDFQVAKNITISPFIAWHKINELPNNFLMQYSLDGGFISVDNPTSIFRQRQIGVNVIFEFIQKKSE